MNRSPLLSAMWLLVFAGVTAMFGLEVASSDGWRSFGFGFCLVCLLVVRDDLTKQGAP